MIFTEEINRATRGSFYFPSSLKAAHEVISTLLYTVEDLSYLSRRLKDDRDIAYRIMRSNGLGDHLVVKDWTVDFYKKVKERDLKLAGPSNRITKRRFIK